MLWRRRVARQAAVHVEACDHLEDDVPVLDAVDGPRREGAPRRCFSYSIEHVAAGIDGVHKIAMIAVAPPILVAVQRERRGPQGLAHHLPAEDAAPARRHPELLARRAEEVAVDLHQVKVRHARRPHAVLDVRRRRVAALLRWRGVRDARPSCCMSRARPAGCAPQHYREHASFFTLQLAKAAFRSTAL